MKNATILIMERNARTYLKLFLTTLEISAFTFGGGYVIIPLMRRTFVSRRKARCLTLRPSLSPPLALLP